MKLLNKINAWYKKSAIKYYMNHGEVPPDDSIMVLYCLFIAVVWNAIVCFLPAFIFITAFVFALGNMPAYYLPIMTTGIWALGMPNIWFLTVEFYSNYKKKTRRFWK